MIKRIILLVLVLLLAAIISYADPIMNSIPGQSVNEGQSLTINLTNTNPDNGSTAYSFASNPSITFGTVTKIDNARADLRFTPSFTNAGTYSITAIARDQDSNSTSTFTLTVNNVNRAPVISLPSSRTIAIGGTGELALTSSLASDPDTDTLSFSIASENSSAVDCAITNGNKLIFTGTGNFIGTSQCVVVASDGQLSANDSLNIIVQAASHLFGTTGNVQFDEQYPGSTVTKTVTIRNAGNSPLTNVVLMSNVPEIYRFNISIANIGTMDPNDVEQITLSAFIPNSTDSGIRTIGNLFVQSAETSTSLSLALDVKGRLEIEDLDVTVETEVDDNVIDGDTISQSAKPLDRLEFDLTIANNYPNDEDDIQIEDITVKVTIKDIDDGRDIKEETSRFDIDADSDDDVTIEMEVPRDVEEQSYDVVIEVEGRDELRIKQTDVWNVKLTVDKDSHDLKIYSSSIIPNKVKCGDLATLSVDVVNFGSKDENDARFTAQSIDLGLDIDEQDLEINEDPDDNDYRNSYRINVPKNLASGTYTVTMKSFYSGNIADDLVRQTLEVVCGIQASQETDDTEPEQAEPEDNEPTVSGESEQIPQDQVMNQTQGSQSLLPVRGSLRAENTTSGNRSTQSGISTLISITSGPSYLVILVLINIVVVIVLIIGAFHYFGKNK